MVAPLAAAKVGAALSPAPAATSLSAATRLVLLLVARPDRSLAPPEICWRSRSYHSAATTSESVLAPLEKLVGGPLIGWRATVPLGISVPRPTSRSAGLSIPITQ